MLSKKQRKALKEARERYQIISEEEKEKKVSVSSWSK